MKLRLKPEDFSEVLAIPESNDLLNWLKERKLGNKHAPKKIDANLSRKKFLNVCHYAIKKDPYMDLGETKLRRNRMKECRSNILDVSEYAEKLMKSLDSAIGDQVSDIKHTAKENLEDQYKEELAETFKNELKEFVESMPEGPAQEEPSKDRQEQTEDRKPLTEVRQRQLLITNHLAVAVGLSKQYKIREWQEMVGKLAELAEAAARAAEGIPDPGPGRPRLQNDQAIRLMADAWFEYFKKKPSAGPRSQFYQFLEQLTKAGWMRHISDTPVRSMLEKMF